MKGKFWRKALAAALALLIVSGGVPVKPFTDILSPVAITASATVTSVKEGADILDENKKLIYAPEEIHPFDEGNIPTTLILWVNWDGEVLEIDENALI